MPLKELLKIIILKLVLISSKEYSWSTMLRVKKNIKILFDPVVEPLNSNDLMI